MYTLVEGLVGVPGLEFSAIVLNQGKLASKLKELGITVTIIEESRNDFFKLRRLAIESLRNKNIDIIHSHRFKENILAASLKRRCKIKRLVQTIHGANEPRRGLASVKSRFFSSLNRYVTRRYFDAMIPVSEDIKGQLSGYYPDTKLHAIHNAIDPRKIKPAISREAVRAEFGIETGAPLIGAAGRMVPVKAYDKFLGMAKLILETRPEARFLLIGDGPLQKSLEDMAAKINIREQVIFPGFRDDIIDIVNALDIFVFSSSHEGIPMALLEAMVLKKAVVSTAVGGINEVIENGVSGVLTASQTPKDLADACLRVLDDKKLLADLGEAAARRVDEEFSIDMLRNRVVRLYQETLNS